MITENLIERHFNSGRYEALLDILAANDSPLPLTLRVRLAQQPACCVGLALGRLVDLTWCSTALSRAMTGFLVEQLENEISIAKDPLALAVIAAGLGKIATEHTATSNCEVTTIREQALINLAGLQNTDASQPLFGAADDRTVQERALVSVFILHLLVRDQEFRRVVCFAELLSWFEQHRRQLDDDTQQLIDLARLRMGSCVRGKRSRKAAAA